MASARARRHRRRAARARLARGRVDLAVGRRDPGAVLRRAEHPDRAPLAGGVRADGRHRLPPVRLPVLARPSRRRPLVPRGARAPAGARRAVARALGRGRARDRPPARRRGAARRDLLRARRLCLARVGRAVVRARAGRPAGLRGDRDPRRGRSRHGSRDDEGPIRLRRGGVLRRRVVARGGGAGRRRPAGRGPEALDVVLARGRRPPGAAAADDRLLDLVLLPPRRPGRRLRRQGADPRGGGRATDSAGSRSSRSCRCRRRGGATTR